MPRDAHDETPPATDPPESAPARGPVGRPDDCVSSSARGDAHGRPVPRLPWLDWEVGERVVLRYRLDDGLHDALGRVLETHPDHVTVATRRGPVRVEATTMVTGKRVPPPRPDSPRRPL